MVYFEILMALAWCWYKIQLSQWARFYGFKIAIVLAKIAKQLSNSKNFVPVYRKK